ncbi:MAG TPA: hypothetical protein VM735_03765, partial [Candidatus Kapabacteria bacterium]|nr:hypothetical protein [Candidatus Kapabacteria bacterium]
MAVILRLICLLFASAAAFGASTNDYFTNRIVLFGTLPSGTGNLTGATVEPGEPHSYNSSLWWEWTPNYEGGISVSTVGNSIYPAALVYSGEWPNLTLVSSPRPSSLFIQPTPVSFYALSNTTYYLAVAANTNFTTGAVAIRTGSAPAADSFSRANPIIGTNVSSTQSLRGTTIEPGEISSSTNVVGTLWHRWTNTFASRYVIQGVSSSGPLNLAVYSGDSVTNLTRLASAENTSILGGARVVLDLEPATYYIAIEDLGFQSTATFSIRLVPYNDDFADRAVLPSDPDVFSSVPFLGATREAGEPGSTNGSVWWEWTAP